AGSPSAVKVFETETRTLSRTFSPFGSDFTGGVKVASADVTGDGVADIIAAAGPGGGPHVVVYDGATGAPLPGPLGSFFAFDLSFRGGVEVAAGDVNGDNRADVVVAASPGGGPHVKVYSGYTGEVMHSFFAFEP